MYNVSVIDYSPVRGNSQHIHVRLIFKGIRVRSRSLPLNSKVKSIKHVSMITSFLKVGLESTAATSCIMNMPDSASCLREWAVSIIIVCSISHYHKHSENHEVLCVARLPSVRFSALYFASNSAVTSMRHNFIRINTDN